jgi:hypothetical protein
MKNCLIFTVFLFSTFSFSQSKKEQIEILTNRVDSLNRLLGSERDSNQNKINELNSGVTKLEGQIEVLSNERDSISQILNSERSTSLKTITELNSIILNVENQLQTLTKELETNKSEFQFLNKKTESLQKSISFKNDSIRKLTQERPMYFVVQDSLTISAGENFGEIVHFERLSIPSNISIENKINEMIYTLHNFNFNGYECHPNNGYNSYLNKVPLAFKKINDKEINYFASYEILIKDGHNFSLILFDENYNLIKYDFNILDRASDSGEFFELYFDRRYLDDPEREH